MHETNPHCQCNLALFSALHSERDKSALKSATDSSRWGIVKCPMTTKSPLPERSPLLAAALAQAGGIVFVLLLTTLMLHWAQVYLWGIPLILAMLQGAVAALIAFRQDAPRWWLAIHLAFAPLVVVVHGLGIPPGWFLVAFILLLLVFWRTDISRVPLYLTNRNTAEELLKFLPDTYSKVIDLGCGDGGLLRRLAQARPDCHFVGIEHAPLTWLVAQLRAWGLPNLNIKLGDFWNEPLGNYGVVYAFLSPAPMPRLWEKAGTEMATGSTLISNSFAVPDVVPADVIDVDDRRATRLYVYRPAGQVDKGGDSAAFPAIPRPSNQE